MMTANLNIIYYVPVDLEGFPTEDYARCAYYDSNIDAWVDTDRNLTIEFIGLVLGENGVYSSPKQEDVEHWILFPNSR